MVNLIKAQVRNNTAIVSAGISIAVVFLGAYGSSKHDRSLLMTFSVILIVATIVGFVSNVGLYLTLGMSIVLIILSLTQTELIKRGYH